MDTMTPLIKPTTEGQIGKFIEKMAAMLRKHKTDIPSNVFQQVLENNLLLEEMYASIFECAMKANKMILIRTVRLNLNQSPQEALNSTGATLYVNDSVVEEMPRGNQEDLNIVFFKVNRDIKDANLEKEYARRGLEPVDPFSLAKVNADDHSFSDHVPNCTHWKNKKGEWCYSRYSRNKDQRAVDIECSAVYHSHHFYWWFAGIKK